MKQINPLPAKFLIVIFTHLKFCLADEIHNFKRVNRDRRLKG